MIEGYLHFKKPPFESTEEICLVGIIGWAPKMLVVPKNVGYDYQPLDTIIHHCKPLNPLSAIIHQYWNYFTKVPTPVLITALDASHSDCCNRYVGHIGHELYLQYIL